MTALPRSLEIPDDFPPEPQVQPKATPRTEPKPVARSAAPILTPQPVNGIGREPPHSAEVEEYLLSCCLLDGGETLAKCDILSPDAFYSAVNRVVFNAMRAESKEKPPLTIEGLVERLRDSKQLSDIGGLPYLMRVSARIPTTAQAINFRDKVHQLHMLREFIKLNTTAVENAYAFSGELPELMLTFRRQVESLDSRVSSQAAGYTIWTLDDLENFVPPTDWGILAEHDTHPVWSLSRLATLIGAGGIGKSRLALSFAVSQIINTHWCGLLTIPPARKWLFVGNENSTTRLKSDLIPMTAGLKKAQIEAVKKHLFIQVLGTTEDSFITLDDPLAGARWRATLAKIKPDILVIDPWESVIIGGDVNDAAATRETWRVIQGYMLGAGLVPTVLVVHHAKTGADATRSAVGYDAASFAKGSKTLFSISRLQINVAAGDDEDGGKLVIACGKCNDAKVFTTRGVALNEETQHYEIDTGFDLQNWIDDVEGKRSGGSVTIQDCVEAIKSGKTRAGDIVEYLKQQGGGSARTIARRLGEACKRGYLQGTMPRGSYTLGEKKLDAPVPPEVARSPYNEG